MSINVHDQQPVFIDSIGLHGVFGVPEGAKAAILIASARANGRLLPRNNELAEGLRAAGFATLLLDLLSLCEERNPARASDVSLMASRVASAAVWLGTGLTAPIGFMAMGLGAAAILRAGSAKAYRVGAITCCGGPLELAGSPALSRLRAPVQLIVGGLDCPGLEAGRAAIGHLRCVHEMAVVSNAHRDFEDPGAIDAVAGHALRWFNRYLR